MKEMDDLFAAKADEAERLADEFDRKAARARITFIRRWYGRHAERLRAYAEKYRP